MLKYIILMRSKVHVLLKASFKHDQTNNEAMSTSDAPVLLQRHCYLI